MLLLSCHFYNEEVLEKDVKAFTLLPSLHCLKAGRKWVQLRRRCPCRGWSGWLCRTASSFASLCWTLCPSRAHHSMCKIFHSWNQKGNYLSDIFPGSALCQKGCKRWVLWKYLQFGCRKRKILRFFSLCTDFHLPLLTIHNRHFSNSTNQILTTVLATESKRIHQRKALRHEKASQTNTFVFYILGPARRPV